MRLRGRGRSTARTSPMVAAGPLVIITMRSDSRTASSTSWVTITTVLWVLATICSSSSCSLARVSASSAPKGSSISRTLGSIDRARAMPTRCFMPPEISPGRLVAAGVRPTRASAASVRALSWDRFSVGPKTRSTARYTFSKQVSQGSSEWFWNTTPRSGPGPEISRLASRMPPSVGISSPATRLRSVLLPQPEWPMSVTNSPLRIDKSIPLRIVEEEKDMPRPSTLTYFSRPIAESPRREHQRLLEQQADHADGEDGDDDVLDLEVVPFVPDPEADAHAAGE